MIQRIVEVNGGTLEDVRLIAGRAPDELRRHRSLASWVIRIHKGLHHLMIVAPLQVNASYGIYVHIPFCAHICPYCDFTTYAGKQDLIPRYVDALCREIERSGPAVADRCAATVFIGGGTPSLLSADQMSRILDSCRSAFALDREAEISVECNPNGLNADLLTGYRAAGVNRLSIGAQTLDRRGLRTLGRHHEAIDVLSALAAARSAGFSNVSVDLIFSWPGQTLESWKSDLGALLQLQDAPEHLSLYSLIVEPGTPFADAAARGILRIPDDDAAADLYEAAIEMLAAAGWTHYEVANWARTPELYSRHNAIYWQYGNYLGLGAGAHGHVSPRRTMNHLLPETYCEAVERGEAGVSRTEVIDPCTQRGETMMLGLRLLREGVNAEAFQRRHGISFSDAFGDTVDELERIGMIVTTPTGIRLSERGLMLANDVVARFL
ncbi:MAG: radical SAM family heme chaperone HemW [Chloroflexota bacterium]|nr:radical SAM family heme chaperone HemW [Chloroflexota bacterium]